MYRIIVIKKTVDIDLPRIVSNFEPLQVHSLIQEVLRVVPPKSYAWGIVLVEVQRDQASIHESNLLQAGNEGLRIIGARNFICGRDDIKAEAEHAIVAERFIG